jgi:hypothetical protein
VDWDARALLDEVRRVARERVASAPIHKVAGPVPAAG